MGRAGYMAGNVDLSPTRKGHTNDKSPLWRRHTMSNWHRSTFGEESNFVKPGKIIVDRPLRTLSGDARLHSSNISSSMSMTFSDRIITPELMTPHIITNASARPPRHLDPRIRGWDLNTSVWWPNVLQNVNQPWREGRAPGEPASRPASGASSRKSSAKKGKRNSGSAKDKRDSGARASSAPLPVMRTAMPLTVSPHHKTAAFRRHVEHLHKGSHLTVGDHLGRGGGSDLHYSHFHHCESRHPTRLIYDMPHADQGADREYTYNVGHTVGPSSLVLAEAVVP